MFSGIVETLGIIRLLNQTIDSISFQIEPQIKFDDLRIGDSVSINGVCLTVTEIFATTFAVTAVPETLRLTNLGELRLGAEVNLERSLLVGARNGGHNVQGHVDALGKIIDIEADGKDAITVKISVPERLGRYIVNKGYIGLDGMSITVIEANKDWFTVMFIPHTQQVTIVKHYQIGTNINVEVDIYGKYVEKLLAG